jgi:hypothetical protein
MTETEREIEKVNERRTLMRKLLEFLFENNFQLNEIRNVFKDEGLIKNIEVHDDGSDDSSEKGIFVEADDTLLVFTINSNADVVTLNVAEYADFDEYDEFFDDLDNNRQSRIDPFVLEFSITEKGKLTPYVLPKANTLGNLSDDQKIILAKFKTQRAVNSEIIRSNYFFAKDALKIFINEFPDHKFVAHWSADNNMNTNTKVFENNYDPSLDNASLAVQSTFTGGVLYQNGRRIEEIIPSGDSYILVFSEIHPSTN